MLRERCPGAGDWAVDEYCWLNADDHLYFCRGCGGYFKVPQRGRQVGLVPNHKRRVGQGAFAPYSHQQFPEGLR